MLLAAPCFGATAETTPVNDPKLAPVRPAIEAAIDQTTTAGLPPALVASKLREGLAKGASPEAIRTAVERLAANLTAAAGFVAARRPGAPPLPLVRALAEARGRGVDLAATEPMIGVGVTLEHGARAIEVLTDLAARGYPTGRAAALVSQVMNREPASLGRVAPGLESLRRSEALSREETVDAMTRGLATGDTFQNGLARALENEHRGVGPQAATRAGKSEAGHGKSETMRSNPSGGVPPGKAKK